MVMSAELEELKQRAEAHGWDVSRLIQLSNALRLMTVKYTHDKQGNRMPYLTCFKSKKLHHSWCNRHRDNF